MLSPALLVITLMSPAPRCLRLDRASSLMLLGDSTGGDRSRCRDRPIVASYGIEGDSSAIIAGDTGG